MKNNIVLFITGCIMMLMASCLGSGDINTTTEIRNAQIASLVLSHDSITDLNKVKFTIDQLNGLIFNKDSLPYGTQLKKAICTLTYAVGVNATGVRQEAVGDTTIWWNGTDSLDFSQPVNFTTTAYDGLTTKAYKAWVNIHQEVPDLMVWEPYASRMTGAEANEQKVVAYPYKGAGAYLMYVQTPGANRLYYSFATDTRNWEELPLSGLSEEAEISQITPFENTLYVAAAGGLYGSVNGLDWAKVDAPLPVKALLGVVKENRNTSSLLAAVVESGDTYVFARMNGEGEWTEGDALPGNFPVSGFGSLNYQRVSNEYLAIVAGKDSEGRLLNTTWVTGDATGWALLSGEKENFFEKKAGVMLAMYDDKFYLTGGINADDKASKEIYTSIDNGLTWSPADSLKVFPEGYTARGYASIHVDAANYMLIFGGKTSNEAKPLDELWRGRINRLR
ncbi:MAG: DUF6242 domain-containing protein [Tannerellaceae bacterium]|jgi:hypothetical protein|nr:DUF6242 domain-containing protein [Tannerellaceae bacterium]